MSKFNFIIDNGHGGMVDDKYTTSPNWEKDNPKTWRKMFVHDGEPIFEGVFNRKVARLLCDILDENCIDNILLVPENEDISLQERVERVNRLCVEHSKNNMPYILISIHGNAGGGIGDEIWTSKGETASDRFASKFQIGYSKVLPDRKFRKDTSDGDIDKESNFYILKHTICPAFLTENGFFDNIHDAEFMASDEGVRAFVDAHVKGIKEIENYTSEY